MRYFYFSSSTSSSIGSNHCHYSSIRFILYYFALISVVVASFPTSSYFIPIQCATTAVTRRRTIYNYPSHTCVREIAQLYCKKYKEEGVASTVVRDDSPSSLTFGIRRAKYGELGKVADLIVSSFYPEKSALIRPYLYLSELQRLQSNFPYSDPHHHFFIAYDLKEPTGKIVGFVDVDGRPSTLPNVPPRPYLSDLAVQPSYRRLGIAKALIQQCEDIVSNDIMKHDELYLRVERANDAAITMYQSLHYHSLPHPFFGVKDTTILLHKHLFDNNSQIIATENTTTTTATTATNIVLDYVV